MSYTTPKTDWNEEYEPSPEDMNRIEENIDILQSGLITISGNKTFTGDNTFSGDVILNGTAKMELGSSAFYDVGTSSRYLHGTYTSKNIFDALSPFISTIGQEMMITGYLSGTASRAKRIDSTTVRVYHIRDGEQTATDFITPSPPGGAIYTASLSW